MPLMPLVNSVVQRIDAAARRGAAQNIDALVDISNEAQIALSHMRTRKMVVAGGGLVHTPTGNYAAVRGYRKLTTAHRNLQEAIDNAGFDGKRTAAAIRSAQEQARDAAALLRTAVREHQKMSE